MQSVRLFSLGPNVEHLEYEAGVIIGVFGIFPFICPFCFCYCMNVLYLWISFHQVIDLFYVLPGTLRIELQNSIFIRTVIFDYKTHIS